MIIDGIHYEYHGVRKRIGRDRWALSFERVIARDQRPRRIKRSVTERQREANVAVMGAYGKRRPPRMVRPFDREACK